MARSTEDLLEDQHNTYLTLISESGIPLWILSMYSPYIPSSYSYSSSIIIDTSVPGEENPLPSNQSPENSLTDQ